MNTFDEEIKILKEHNLPSLFYNSNYSLVAGIDEVGRGSLAGPVIACCLSFKNNVPKELLQQIQDSKKLSEKKRNELFHQIKLFSYYAIGESSVELIDSINILNATLKAMEQAYIKLSQYIKPNFLIIDGNKSFQTNIPTFTIIQGDKKSLSIAAAAIIAKVYRDQLMTELSLENKAYDWKNNAGYGTKKHLQALKNNGVTKHHRRTFSPIKSMV